MFLSSLLFLSCLALFGNANAGFIMRYNRKPDYLQGDIDIQRSKLGLKNSNIVTNSVGKWENGIVTYKISENFSNEDKQIILESLKLIETQTNNCIKFVEYSANNLNAAWLHFVQEDGCWSWIGRGNGEQWLSLAPGCITQSTIVHEMLHALGFWHEQSRPDRDNYVTINWSNVLSGYESEFNSRPDSIDTMNMPYDYYSIMHYKYNTFAFDTNVATIIPKDLSVDLSIMGIRDNLSDIDILKIQKYYECNV